MKRSSSESESREAAAKRRRGSSWIPGSGRPIPAVVRAHLVEPQMQADVRSEVMRQYGHPHQDSFWPSLTLVFDAVTSPDEFGSLLYGVYFVEWIHPLTHQLERLDTGFFLGERLSQTERAFIEGYCEEQGLSCMTRRAWLEDIFFTIGYRGRGVVVGFDLARQLASIATRAAEIRPQKPKVNKDGKLTLPSWLNRMFAGGWRLTFNEREKKDAPGQWRERAYRPSVWIKPISSVAAMYRWGSFINWQEWPGTVRWPYHSGEGVRGDSGGSDKQAPDRKPEEHFYPGHFVDARTLGLALSKDDQRSARIGRSLRRLGEVFQVKPIAVETYYHEGPLNVGDLDAARDGLEATLALYRAESREFNKHGLAVTPDHIYSGASLGKAHFRAMGITAPPLLDTSQVPYSPEEVLGFAISAYHPGRSEAHIVNVTLPVTLLDFHGMYPTVCMRQGLFSLMRAESIQVVDATAETVSFLNDFRSADSLRHETWERLNVFCLIQPEGDIMPIRADFRRHGGESGSVSYRAGMASITSSQGPLWWPLADCLESKRRTGKAPRVLAALKMVPRGVRHLNPISIRGGPTIDPNEVDFFEALMQARDLLTETDRMLADALKIVANSTSYGMWAEVDLEDGPRAVTAFATEPRYAFIAHGEKPGSFYAPMISALITGGARHMLGVLEGEIAKVGGVTAFCDTDSLAVVSSEIGGKVEFVDHRGQTTVIPVITWKQVDQAIERCSVLSPYHWARPLIKLEPENFIDKSAGRPRTNLHAYVLAAKRYGLFLPSQEPGQRPQIIKASYHTIGIAEPPRNEQGQEIADWIEEMWAHLPDHLPFNPSWTRQPVEFQLPISRPAIRHSFRSVRGRTRTETGNKYMNGYLRSVKPYGTVAALQKSRVAASLVENVGESDGLRDIPVIAPVSLRGSITSRRWVAKDSGKPVYLLSAETASDVNEVQAIRESVEAADGLMTTPMTFQEYMAEYRRHHESKALDAYGQETTADTRGQLTYPRVRITEIIFTGKETTLQDEIERGLISESQAASDRVLIPPEVDPDARVAVEASRLLSKAELKRLGLSRRGADHVKAQETDAGNGQNASRVPPVEVLAVFLTKEYPDEATGAKAQQQIQSFILNRMRLLEQWNLIKPKLQGLATKQIMAIAGCSRGTAKNLKFGRTEPGIETIKKLVNECSRLDAEGGSCCTAVRMHGV